METPPTQTKTQPTSPDPLKDTDHDGNPDATDPDDDNDGISDATEGNGTVDTDHDGTPDSRDLDSDNDLVPDRVEGGTTDTDHDGTPNFRDPDDDGDGIPTRSEDTNGDGDPTNDDANGNDIPNYLDPASPTAITLVSLTGKRIGPDVLVEWATSAEMGTRGFHILRSTTGNRADAQQVTVTLVPATGRGQNGATYRWIDRNAPTGTVTYWLQEVEDDGHRIDYGPVTVDPVPASTTYTLFLPIVGHK